MCKIIRYRYACQHGFSVRLSKCGGTKHKQSRRRPTAACKPGAYINMFIPVNCGPCEFLAFERDRDRKLSMAEGFLEKITEKQFPGVLEVAILVDELKNRLSTETWVAQKRFPDTHKDRTIIRVELGHSTAQASPLRNEVLPDDIPEPPEVIHPNHPDYVYDYAYVASTDPLHPVDVNYTVYEADSTWLADYFSSEDLEQTSDEAGFDATDEANTAWTANTPEPPAPTSTTLVKCNEGITSENKGPNSSVHVSGRGDGAQHKEAQHKETATLTQMEVEHIELVIQAFRELVKVMDHPRTNSPPALTREVLDALNHLGISDPTSRQITPHLNSRTSRQAPLHLPTGPRTACPNHATRGSKTRTPNPTRVRNGESRREVSRLKSVDKREYPKKGLDVSRCEVM